MDRSLSRRRGSSRRRSHSPWRGLPTHDKRDRSASPEYKTTCLDRRSRSPSPSQKSPPKSIDYYGTTELEKRSRSPSPVSSARSAPVTGRNRLRVGRRLPHLPGPLRAMANSCLQAITQSVEGINLPTLSNSPTVPAPTQRSPTTINFPKVSASPTRKSPTSAAAEAAAISSGTTREGVLCDTIAIEEDPVPVAVAGHERTLEALEEEALADGMALYDGQLTPPGPAAAHLAATFGDVLHGDPYYDDGLGVPLMPLPTVQIQGPTPSMIGMPLTPGYVLPQGMDPYLPQQPGQRMLYPDTPQPPPYMDHYRMQASPDPYARPPSGAGGLEFDVQYAHELYDAPVFEGQQMFDGPPPPAPQGPPMSFEAAMGLSQRGGGPGIQPIPGPLARVLPSPLPNGFSVAATSRRRAAAAVQMMPEPLQPLPSIAQATAHRQQQQQQLLPPDQQLMPDVMLMGGPGMPPSQQPSIQQQMQQPQMQSQLSMPMQPVMVPVAHHYPQRPSSRGLMGPRFIGQMGLPPKSPMALAAGVPFDHPDMMDDDWC